MVSGIYTYTGSDAMGLITLRQLLDHARERNAAIPAFNVNNLEQILAILEAADYTNSPVIIQASLGARKYAGMTMLKHMMRGALQQYPHLAVCFHQDHGHDPGVCFEALVSGFSSVMMDGSLESDGKTPASFESNVQRTQSVVQVAHQIGRSVEGEIGCLGSLESGLAGDEDGSGAQGVLSRNQMLTDLDQAKAFMEQTNVDALAIAVGTSHGVAKFAKAPNEETFALSRVQELNLALPDVHFVLHGSSSVPSFLIEEINANGGNLPMSYGVPLDLLKKSISFGVRKINIDTDLRLAATAAIRRHFHERPQDFDPRQYLGSAKEAMKKICIEKFEAFGSAGWGSDIHPLSFEKMKKFYK